MSSQLSTARVGICVSGDREDAYRVLEALKAVFPATDDDARRRPSESPPDPAHGHMVWSMIVDTTEQQGTGHGGAASSPPLTGQVAVDLFGIEPPVRRVRTALERAFGIRSESHVSGDQEMELRLRLGP